MTEHTSSPHIDTLIVHGHLFTMQGAGVGYVADGAVAIRGTRIVAVGPTAELSARFQADETIDAGDCAVLPGLIDAHMHTHLAIVRGVAQDVQHWMQKGLAPYWNHATSEAQTAATRLNAVEALKAGTTTHGDYGGARPGWAEFYATLGVRACLTPIFNALPPRGLSLGATGRPVCLRPGSGAALAGQGGGLCARLERRGGRAHHHHARRPRAGHDARRDAARGQRDRAAGRLDVAHPPGSRRPRDRADPQTLWQAARGVHARTGLSGRADCWPST